MHEKTTFLRNYEGRSKCFRLGACRRARYNELCLAPWHQHTGIHKLAAKLTQKNATMLKKPALDLGDLKQYNLDCHKVFYLNAAQNRARISARTNCSRAIFNAFSTSGKHKGVFIFFKELTKASTLFTLHKKAAFSRLRS